MKTNSPRLLLLALALGISQVQAQGIPVYDNAQVIQTTTNHLLELAEMAKQLQEAKNQVEQAKAAVTAMTGIKGFGEILENAGIDDSMMNAFENLLKGDTDDLIKNAGKYFGNTPSHCGQARDKDLCLEAALSPVIEANYAENLDAQIRQKIQKIDDLSRLAKQAQDMKAMAEVQAQIELEAQSIASLQLMAENFGKLQQARKQIAAEQALQEAASAEWAQFERERKGNTAEQATAYRDLIN